MKVKDIVRDCSIWLPGKLYNDSQPIVSVLLPTFKSAELGLFEKAVDSVLNQNLKNIELIIIDDCSTDGTFDLIKYYMDSDSRVSCIRHSYNIGLPAISGYEGYIKARGKYIAFIFDDNEWQKDYLSRTIPFMIKNDIKASYGIAHVHYNERESISVGGKETSDLYNDLLVTNRIASSTVVLEREVIKNVGLYDPHVVLVRDYDWDLNRRISSKYKFEATDVYATDEYQLHIHDSVRISKRINSWDLEERIQTRKQDILLIENYLECDIFEYELNNTQTFIDNVNSLSAEYTLKKWFRNVKLSEGISEKKLRKIIVVSSAYDATMELAFERILECERNNIVLKFHNTRSNFENSLPLSDGVIFVRNLPGFKHLIDMCEKLEIPMYYYLDDNYYLLEEHISDAKQVVELLNRDYLKKFKTFFVSSDKLKDYFNMKSIHDNIVLLDPIIGNVFFEHDHSNEYINIAFMGGKFREDTFLEFVIPALLKVSRQNKINLFCPMGEHSKLMKSYSNENFNINFIQRTISLNKTLKIFGGNGIDVLIHCGPKIENNEYKTENSLINATQLGAILMVSKDYPYLNKYNDCIEKFIACENQIETWYTELLRIIEKPELQKEIYSNAKNYCIERYNNNKAEAILNAEVLKLPYLSYSDCIMRYESLYLDAITNLSNKVCNSTDSYGYIDSDLVFSKYIKNRRSYKVNSSVDLINRIGIIFSSDYYGCSGKLVLNIYQNRKILASSSIDISQVIYGEIMYFQYNPVKINLEKLIILEIIPFYENNQISMGVYEIRKKRNLVYKILNKMNLKPKGKDVLYVEFK